jgi:thioredoxin 1
MPVLDTPITTDDTNLKKVLGQKQPAVLLLYDGRREDKPLQDAMKREAKKYAGDLLVIRVDASQNPDTLAKYGGLSLPAVITLTPAFFGRKVKSTAENARPADLRAHIDHLLNDTPLPEAKPAAAAPNEPKSKKPVVVTDATFQREVLKSKVPVLVDFWAVWCGPCQVIAPYVDQVAGQYSGKLKVVKLNVDENRATAQRYNVQSIPTFMVFEGGQPVSRASGASPRVIQDLIAQVLV